MHAIPRALLIVALVGAVLACVAAIAGSGEATRRAATRAMAARSLDELGLLAGVAGEDGELLRDDPLAVTVIADGGPMWALESVEQAVAGSPYFAVGDSPHLLRTEVIDERGGVALQLHLWRAGWELREPTPSRVWVAPWAALVAGICGAVLAAWTRRPSVGLATAGALAQIFLIVARPPVELFAPRPLAQEWAEGPLMSRVIALIRDMGPGALAVLAAVLAASLVLVWFDHRRTRGSDGDLGLGAAGLAALLGTAGLVAWLEAASRGSLFVAADLRAGAWLGLVGLAGLIVTWLPAIRVGREAWRERS